MGRKAIMPKIGEKFNKWSVLSEKVHRIHKDNKRAVLCQCDCGYIRAIKIYDLIHRTSLGCKNCSQTQKGLERTVKCGGLSLTQYCNFKKSATKRNLSWEVSMEFLWNLFESQKGKCALSGIDLILRIGSERYRKGVVNTASLDRIDSSKGYTEDNVQWVHKDVNFMKQSYSNKYFIEVCKRIYENNK